MDEQAALIKKVAMCRRAWASITDDESRERLIDYTESLEVRLRHLAHLSPSEDNDLHLGVK